MKWLLVGPIRLALFVGVVFGVVYSLNIASGWLDLNLISATASEAWGGNVEALSNKAFAYSLAALIGALGLGIAVAYGLLNVALVMFAVGRSRRVLTKAMKSAKSSGEKQRAYSEAHESVRQRLTESFFVGHAFKEFCETLVIPSENGAVISNTIRPQAFIHPGLARERLPGLKIMPSIPGYFVGIGLLLTFIGLVLALSKAGEATRAGDAAVMTQALNGLLEVASFKFATSIAGLGTSIVLAIVFRVYQVFLEGSFGRFCETLENGLAYQAPQSISAEMNRTLKEQLRELKDITQGEFFARMGREMEPIVARAVSGAMTPVGDRIYEAVGNISNQSSAGMEAMVSKFSENMQSGAGAELRALAETLAQMEKTLSALQNELRGSGEDVSRRLAEAAEGLKALVESAGANMEDSSVKSRDAFAEIARTLKESLAGAGEGLNAKIVGAADASARQIDATMATVLGRLDAQVGQLGAGLAAVQEAMKAEAARSEEEARLRRERVEADMSAERERAAARNEEWTAVQRGAQEGLAAGVDQTAQKLGASIGEITSRMDARFTELGSGLAAMQEAMKAEAGRAEEDARQRRLQADADQSAERERSTTRTQEWEAAQRRAQEGLAASVGDVAEKLGSAIEQAIGRVEARFGELGLRLSEVERALSGQTLALQGTAGEARKTADALSDTAQQIRVATPPLIQVGERFSAASEGVNASLRGTLHVIETAKGDIGALAASLSDANHRSSQFWEGFQTKFDDVDTALGRAVTTLSSATINQSDSLREQVQAVDSALADAIGKLQPLLGGLEDAVGDLADSVGHMKRSPAETNGSGHGRPDA